MTRRLFLTTPMLAAAGARLRLAVFRADVTPPRGAPLIWTTPLAEVLDPLWGKGVVLESGAARYVLCALDWCGLGSAVHRLFRARLAAAARTAEERVFVHSVHQHTAPYADGDAYELLAKSPSPPLRIAAAAMEELSGRLAGALREAAWEPFDRIGTSEAVVERVASARRIHAPDGKILVRYSTSGRDPAMAAAPEGEIDPGLRTVTLAHGERPLVRLHFYATHPQTFCCDGRGSADFVGAARERFERDEGVPQIYFTGCAGDVTVGKYNDASEAAREALAGRLLTAFQASARAARFEPAGGIEWRTTPLKLPPRKEPPRLETGRGPDPLYRSAIAVGFSQRKLPLQVASLQIGKTRILQLPGEPMLEFQKFARGLRPDAFVAVAGYGDISPGYICTDRAYEEGGYEPGAANAGPGSEAALKAAIERVLGKEAI